jgi:hypothetical protein
MASFCAVAIAGAVEVVVVAAAEVVVVVVLALLPQALAMRALATSATEVVSSLLTVPVLLIESSRIAHGPRRHVLSKLYPR